MNWHGENYIGRSLSVPFPTLLCYSVANVKLALIACFSSINLIHSFLPCNDVREKNV